MFTLPVLALKKFRVESGRWTGQQVITMGEGQKGLCIQESMVCVGQERSWASNFLEELTELILKNKEALDRGRR